MPTTTRDSLTASMVEEKGQTTIPDPFTTTGAMFPLGLRPEDYAALPTQTPEAVSFGFAQATPMPDEPDAAEPPNLTYCSRRQILVMSDGVPAYELPQLGLTTTVKQTRVDMQTFSESDTDRTSVK